MERKKKNLNGKPKARQRKGKERKKDSALIILLESAI